MYRVSHSKVNKVILLWWRHTFSFLLIFWILRVHEIGAFIPSFYLFNDARHPWFKMQTCKQSFWKKEFECTSSKAIFWILFSTVFWGFMPFGFEPLIKVKYIPIFWLVTFYFLTIVLKFKIIENSRKNKRHLRIWL